MREGCIDVDDSSLSASIRFVSPNINHSRHYSPTQQATLINSANLMGGNSEPDGFRGFGRVHLDAGLPLDGTGALGLLVVDSNTTYGARAGAVRTGAIMSRRRRRRNGERCELLRVVLILRTGGSGEFVHNPRKGAGLSDDNRPVGGLQLAGLVGPKRSGGLSCTPKLFQQHTPKTCLLLGHKLVRLLAFLCRAHARLFFLSVAYDASAAVVHPRGLRLGLCLDSFFCIDRHRPVLSIGDVSSHSYLTFSLRLSVCLSVVSICSALLCSELLRLPVCLPARLPVLLFRLCAFRCRRRSTSRARSLGESLRSPRTTGWPRRRL